MSIGLHNPILAQDFISIKARVKAECARRKYNGSVESYSTSSYDYTVQPTERGIPTPEHFNKIIIPMNAMVDTGFNQTQKGYLERDFSSVVSKLATLESIEIDAAVSGCKSSCTGLCQGTCTGTCTGGCTGNCTGNCGGNCTSGCTSNCGGNCAGGCTGGCGNACNRACSIGCSGSCSGGCSKLCQGSCKGLAEYNPVE